MSSYVNWHNSNEQRAYPLRDDTARLDITGRRLPDDIIVDLGIVVPGTAPDLYVGTVYVSPLIVSLTINDAEGIILTGSFSANQRYTALPLSPARENVAGWVTIGGYEADAPWRYTFDGMVDTGIVASAITTITPPEVTRFHDKRGGSVAGIVRLTHDSNFDIYQDAEDPQTIIISLARGARTAFTEPCSLPASEDNCGSPPIRSIGGVPANKNGDLYIVFE